LYLNLSGGVLRPDGDANGDVYGKDASLRTILAGRGVAAPPEAQGFIAALSNQPAAPVAVAPRRIEQGAAAPTRLPVAEARTTDDLRARVVELQQSLDRMLGDTVPVPVGTSGSGAPATVMVDRAQLLALRQQLDVIMAALNRR
jgi:hypothetical protein